MLSLAQLGVFLLCALLLFFLLSILFRVLKTVWVDLISSFGTHTYLYRQTSIFLASAATYHTPPHRSLACFPCFSTYPSHRSLGSKLPLVQEAVCRFKKIICRLLAAVLFETRITDQVAEVECRTTTTHLPSQLPRSRALNLPQHPRLLAILAVPA